MGCGDPRSQKRDLGHPSRFSFDCGWCGGLRFAAVLRLTDEIRHLLVEDGFGQVSWVIYVDSVLDGELVGEELQGHYLQHRG